MGGMNGCNFEFASERLRGDHWVVRKALRMRGAQVLRFATPAACEHHQVQQALAAMQAQKAVSTTFELTVTGATPMVRGRKRRNRGNRSRDAHRLAKPRPRRGGRYKAHLCHYINGELS